MTSADIESQIASFVAKYTPAIEAQPRDDDQAAVIVVIPWGVYRVVSGP